MGAAEAVVEQAQEQIEAVEEVVEIVRNNPAVLGVAVAAGVLIGGAVGYFAAKKQLEQIYEARAEKDMEDAKEFYSSVHKVDSDGKDITPERVLEERHGREALLAYQGDAEEEALLEKAEAAAMVMSSADIRSISVDKEVGPAGGKIERVFASRKPMENDPFDYDVEVELRSAATPYILTHDEYFENAIENEQSTFTYYEEDDTLVDEADRPLDEGTVEEYVTADMLVRFGHGSKDANIVYVRNERLAMDFEIVRSSGSYAREVLGFSTDEPDTLKHSQRRGQSRRFRESDE